MGWWYLVNWTVFKAKKILHFLDYKLLQIMSRTSQKMNIK